MSVLFHKDKQGYSFCAGNMWESLNKVCNYNCVNSEYLLKHKYLVNFVLTGNIYLLDILLWERYIRT